MNASATFRPSRSGPSSLSEDSPRALEQKKQKTKRAVTSFIIVLLGKEGSHLSEPGRKTVYQPPENRPCAIVVETIEFEGNPVMAKCPILAPLVAQSFAAISFSPLHISLLFFYQKRQG
jgi:hypothetical protein